MNGKGFDRGDGPVRGRGPKAAAGRATERPCWATMLFAAIVLCWAGGGRTGWAGASGGTDAAHAKEDLRAGIALQAAGDLPGALAAYERAIVLDPGLAQAHSNVCSVRIARQELAAAIGACQRALALDPSLDPARYNLAQALLGTGRFGEAAKAYEQLARSRPREARVSLGLGSAYFGMRAYREAASAFARALALDGKLLEACYNLAVTREHLGERRQAAADYRRCAAMVGPGPNRDRFEEAARRLEANGP